jgi:hypothetical protein
MPCLPARMTWQQLVAAAQVPGAGADTHGDEPAFWLYSSGSTGAPKGTVHTQANLYWTAELYGKAVLGLQESDTVFSAAKLFFAYGLGNALSFPLSVGASVVLMAERPTPQAVFKRLVDHQPTVFYGAPTGYGGMLASPDLPTGTRWRCACARRPARRCRATLASAGPPISAARSSTASAPPKCCTSSCPTARATCATAPPARRAGLRGAAAQRRRQRDHRPQPDRRPLHPGPERGTDVLEQPRQDARHLPGPLDQERRQIHPRPRRLLHLRRPQRRHAQGQRHLREPVRGGGHAGAAPGRAGSRRDRQDRRRRPDQDQGLSWC